jgi:hypothetical protein
MMTGLSGIIFINRTLTLVRRTAALWSAKDIVQRWKRWRI